MNNKETFNLLTHLWHHRTALPLPVSRDFSEYALGVLPPIYTDFGFGLGETYSHNSDGYPIHYWVHERAGQAFAVLGTKAEAANIFASIGTVDSATMLKMLLRVQRALREEGVYPNARDYAGQDFQTVRAAYQRDYLDPVAQAIGDECDKARERRLG